MKKQLLTLLVLVTLALAAPGQLQLIYHTVPQGYDVTDGGYSPPSSH